MKRIKPIQIDIDNPECSNSGLVFKGKNTNQPASNNTIKLLNLTGYGNDFFNNHYYAQVIKNSDNPGVAPESEVRKILDYDSATGIFTTDAFSDVVDYNDDIVILHETLVAIGRNDSNNTFNSSNVSPNKDGSILEMEKYIISIITGGALDLRVSYSESSSIEVGGIIQFTIGLMDIDSGAIPAANIDITSIVQTMERSRGGGAWDPIIDPVVNFQKADGQVYMSYEAKGTEWQNDDMYRMTLSGILVTIGTQIAHVPAHVWSNKISDDSTIHTDVKYLYAVADGGALYPTKVLDNSILSILMTKDSGGDTSDFDNSIHSFQAIGDEAIIIEGKVDDVQTDLGNPSLRTNLKSIESMLGNPDSANKTIYGNIGDFVGNTNLQTLKDSLAIPDTAGKGLYVEIVTDRLDNATYGLSALNTDLDNIQTDLGNPSLRTNLKSIEAMLGNPDVAGASLYTTIVTDRLDNATYGLSALETLVDDVETELAKVPKSDSNVTWNATALASINSEVDTALNTIVPVSPTAGSLNDILSKAAGANTFNKALHSLEALRDKLDTMTTATGAGVLQIASTTIDLQQAAGDYDLFTGTTQAVLLESITFSMPNRDASGDATITYITIQTDHATPQVLINSTSGAKANLTAENQIIFGGMYPIYIPVNKKIKLTIAGGAADASTVCNVIAQYRAVVSGGTLA